MNKHTVSHSLRRDEFGDESPTYTTFRRIADSGGERDRRYREVFQHTRDGVFVLDVTRSRRFRIIEVNPAQERMMGITNDQAAGHYVEEIFPPEIADPFVANLHRCFNSATPIRYENAVLHETGRRSYSIVIVPLFDDVRRVFRIIGVTHDVTTGASPASEIAGQRPMT